MAFRQFHFEIVLFYWHHSHIPSTDKDILSIKLLEINYGNGKARRLLYYCQLPMGVHILNLFFLPSRLGLTWQSKQNGK